MASEHIVDPGNEFSGPSNKKLVELIVWLRKHPDMTLRSGEGKLLLDEIDRLAAQVLLLQQGCGSINCEY